MPINVSCDHCGQSLQVLEEHSGKQVRCPKCYQVFVAKVSAGMPPAPVAGESVPVSAPSPAGGFQPGAAPPPLFCPHCGVGLPAAAGFCPACGKPPGQGAFAPASFSPSGTVPAPYGAPAQTNGLATASLVLAIASWACLGPLCSIPAVICGHMARGQVKRSNGTQTGETLANIGLVIGYINLLLWCGYVGFFSMAGMSHGRFP
ncbi:MAG: DUF4190 domain-containing protein [Planctomycetota bacterium]